MAVVLFIVVPVVHRPTIAGIAGTVAPARLIIVAMIVETYLPHLNIVAMVHRHLTIAAMGLRHLTIAAMGHRHLNIAAMGLRHLNIVVMKCRHLIDGMALVLHHHTVVVDPAIMRMEEATCHKTTPRTIIIIRLLRLAMYPHEEELMQQLVPMPPICRPGNAILS
jgi:hypothetical protein